MSLQCPSLFKAFMSTIVIIFTSSASLLATAESLPDVDHQAITIWSQGVRLAGDIYKPKGLKPDVKLPGILKSKASTKKPCSAKWRA